MIILTELDNMFLIRRSTKNSLDATSRKSTPIDGKSHEHIPSFIRNRQLNVVHSMYAQGCERLEELLGLASDVSTLLSDQFWRLWLIGIERCLSSRSCKILAITNMYIKFYTGDQSLDDAP